MGAGANLDQIIKICYENLPKLKTPEEVNKYLMEFIKAANKWVKATLGLGKIKLTINKDKILSHDINQATAYCEKFKKVLQGSNRPLMESQRKKTSGEVIWERISSLPVLRQKSDEAIRELRCLIDNQNNFALVSHWFRKLIEATDQTQLPAPPDCPGLRYLCGLWLLRGPQTLARALRGVGGGGDTKITNAVSDFDEFATELQKNFGSGNGSVLIMFAYYKACGDVGYSRWWPYLRKAARYFVKLVDSGHLNLIIESLERALSDYVDDLQALYEEQGAVQREDYQRRRIRALRYIQTVKTEGLNKGTVRKAIDCLMDTGAYLNLKRPIALGRLKRAVKKLPDSLLPKK